LVAISSVAVMIYIGRVGYGPKLDRLPLSSAMDVVRDTLREELGSANAGASIDIVLHIPGSLGAPDFDGVRTGLLSHRDRIVQAEVAVPRAIADSLDPTGPLLELVASAIVAGAADLRSAGVDFDASAHARALDRTAERLGTPPPRGLRLKLGTIPRESPAVRVSVPVVDASSTFQIEDALVALIEDAGIGWFEGNEVGEGEHVMYFASDDLAALFDVLSTSAQSLAPRAVVTLEAPPG
jgi:hypothetical protein